MDLVRFRFFEVLVQVKLSETAQWENQQLLTFSFKGSNK